MVREKPHESQTQDDRILRKVAQELSALEGMGLTLLRDLYHELFGEESRSKNLPYLRKKLAYRIQERLEGGLSPQALARIEELGPKELPQAAPSRRPTPAPASAPVRTPSPRTRDPRLPAPGSILVREHEGVAHEVEVLNAGFRYRGRMYSSLSSLAKAITGTAWNGFLFFGLVGRKTHGH